MMNYIGIDGNAHSDELKHWKYIKKIKSGSGWRYFYTPEEVRAYSAKKVTKGKAKTKKIVKSEAAGTKRVLNATRGKGNNSYSVDGKTYNKYDRKKQRLGKKKYKTSKLERAILKGYRATHPYE